MSDIGPELPPHLLAKRKRKQEEAPDDASATASGAKRMPSISEGEKRRRAIGPAMPPGPIEERPIEPSHGRGESDSEDDGFGPPLPPDGVDEGNNETNKHHTAQAEHVSSEEKVQRDEWMMMPPKQDDLAARLDPTKQRARGFNTGKGARGPPASSDDSSAWHETPEQKQKRLADEMMGVANTASTGPQRPPKGLNARSHEASAVKTQEHANKNRGPSLLDQHQGTTGKEVEDDPSKRAFDREKDMGSGMRIGHSQRKELLSKASNSFSTKFSGGSYL